MDIRFAGRTVIVTGAVRGIGRRIAHDFAARGAEVHALDILEDRLGEVVAEARPAEGGTITPHVVDVTDADADARLVTGIEKASAGGAIDILVHSAGGTLGQHRQPLESVEPADFRALFEVNVMGAFNFARAVAPGMKRAGSGRIVVISSRAGINVSLTGIVGYGSAKAGQIGFVKQIAAELGPFGITVNSVAPGFMPTSPAYERQYESYGDDGQKRLVEGIAMRRLGEPADIAHAVMFFASDYAGFVTGQTLCVTGSP